MIRHLSTIATLVLLAFGAAGGNITGSIRAAFPSDVGQRQALSRCAAGDAGFFRFSSEDRAACYRHQHVPTPDAPINVTNLAR